jgi:hypothetical protein
MGIPSTASPVPSPITSDDFAEFMRTEQAKWGPLVLATGAKLE